MTLSKRLLKEWDEQGARFEAEDRGIERLNKLPTQIALATATKVLWKHAMRWQVVQDEMIERRDPQKDFPITGTRFKEACTAYRTHGQTSDPAAERHINKLLSGFAPDKRWSIARKLAVHAASSAGESCCPPPWRAEKGDGKLLSRAEAARYLADNMPGWVLPPATKGSSNEY